MRTALLVAELLLTTAVSAKAMTGEELGLGTLVDRSPIGAKLI